MNRTKKTNSKMAVTPMAPKLWDFRNVLDILFNYLEDHWLFHYL